MNANVNKRSFRIERMPFEMQRAIEHLPTFFGVMLSGRVDAKLRERVLLAVSGANRCRYCAFVHGLWAKRVGVEASEVERLAAGESGPDEELAIELARDFVASGGTLSAEPSARLLLPVSPWQ